MHQSFGVKDGGYRHELYIVNSLHTQTSIQWTLLSYFPGIKRPKRVADHSLVRSTEIMNVWSYVSNPSQLLWLDGQTLHLVAYTRRLRCEGKRIVAVFFAGILQYNYSQFRFKIGMWPSQATHLTNDITCSVWGYMAYGLNFFLGNCP
jgi:hypothetical protein